MYFSSIHQTDSLDLLTVFGSSDNLPEKSHVVGKLFKSLVNSGMPLFMD